MRFPYLIAILALALGAAPVRAETPDETSAPAPRPGRIVFAAARGAGGAEDIFSGDLAGERIVNLTDDPAPDRSPSWSPDGRQIAFASRRDGNWDLYLIAADGTGLRRLTDHPAYDGEPAWSPDGARLAFTSSRDGNLEVYTLDVAGGALQRLTDHPAADGQPAWAPGGAQIAFTSWRDGNQEIYRLPLRAGQPLGEPINVSDHPAPDHGPAWAPDGRRLAFVSDREGSGNLHVLDTLTGREELAGPQNRSLQSPSWTPGGGLLAVGAWTNQGRGFGSRTGVLITRPGVEAGVFLLGSNHGYGEPEWSARALAPQAPEERVQEGRPLPVPGTPPDLSAVPRGFAGLGEVRSGGLTKLAAAVQPSFMELRRAVIEASGHDFLAHLSEASRAVGFQSGTSSYTSWHKAGRAFDTLFDYSAGGRQVLYITPEWRAGRLFWRLYLRASRQDGTQGAPLFAPVFSTGSRELLPPPPGYFVDFTALAAQHGWSRIAAQERETFDWRSEPLALEYWHFEKRDGLSWYAAMSLVHEEETLAQLFSLERMAAAGRTGNFGNLGLPWAPPSPAIPGAIRINSGRPS
jgi:TolB protein